MRGRMLDSGRAGVVIAALTLLSFSSTRGQERMPVPDARSEAPRQGGWHAVTSPALDLWFHGLALTGLAGFGATPLYDPAYALRVHDAKRAAGTGPTRLEREAGVFRTAFERDSAFEVLHFLPLVVPIRDPSSLLRVVRAVASGDATAASADPGVRSIAAALLAALPLPAERRVLGAWADALEDEWRVWLRSSLAEDASAREAAAARAEAFWRRQVEPSLAGWLHASALDSGTMVLTPALGAEGRFIEGDPANRADNIVAVREGEPEDVVVAVLRELCYPTVRAAIARSGVELPDRVEATRISDRAATVCGAVLAARVSEALATRFQARFAAATPDRGGTGLPPAIEAALREELERRKG